MCCSPVDLMESGIQVPNSTLKILEVTKFNTYTQNFDLSYQCEYLTETNGVCKNGRFSIDWKTKTARAHHYVETDSHQRRSPEPPRYPPSSRDFVTMHHHAAREMSPHE